jgi:hypothetical protein
VVAEAAGKNAIDWRVVCKSSGSAQAEEPVAPRATCLNVSLRGALVECSEPIVARSSVYLSAPSYGLMGNAPVRYCRRKGMKFVIGLEFTWAAALAEEGRKRKAPGPK